jgi:hypothetical protein
MTHDELLKRIDIDLTGLLLSDEHRKDLRALRAIVALHHPKDTKLGYHICAAEKDNWAWKHCETIQAIKKELSNG